MTIMAVWNGTVFIFDEAGAGMSRSIRKSYAKLFAFSQGR